MLFLFAGIVGILGVGLWLFDLLRNRTATAQQTTDSEEKGGSPKKLTAISKGGGRRRKRGRKLTDLITPKKTLFFPMNGAERLP